MRRFSRRRSSRILGPPIFNIYLNYLFYLTKFTEVCNSVDETTFFARDKDLKFSIKRLEHDRLPLATEWFENINMKLN